MRQAHKALLILVTLCAAASAVAQGNSQIPESLLYAWLKDNDGEDPAFLAVIDADPGSATYGELLTTSPTGEALADAHHTPHQLPLNGRIFANAFRDGKTFIYNIEQPHIPALTGQFETIDGYSYPHSFVELPSGNFLATFQSRGENHDQVGGLLELTQDGELVRAASAADPGVTGFIRPYSLELFPDVNRVISSSADMWQTQATEHMQLWRLSDLTLLQTFALPSGDRRNIQQIPLETRQLDDGSAYVTTWNCGLYHLTGIDGSSVTASLVWDFASRACAVPVRVGNYWIQTVGEAHQIVVLDIRNPAEPQLATVRQLPNDFQPHWLAAEPGGNRLVLTGYNALADRIVLLRWDPRVEALSVITDFGAPDDELPGFRTDRRIWPHGKTGNATAHGVFVLASTAG